MKRAKKKYAKLNHLQITVRDAARSRDWYVENIGLKVEFEVPQQGFVALEDDWGMALLISRGKLAKGAASGFAIYFEVEDVDARYEVLKANGGNRNVTADPFPRGKGNRIKRVREGVKIVHEPKRTAWGYGPELRDPDGYIVRLFDYRSITK
jgi:catechol 2,3-dioxygenase-like lactoylglutathione lyase family enzyme